jgi:hypothetical protein
MRQVRALTMHVLIVPIRVQQQSEGNRKLFERIL